MQAYTLNRDDRPDRLDLWRNAMKEQGFTDAELHHKIAYKAEDYDSRLRLCEEAANDFPEFFEYQKDKTWPAYGHIVTTWGWLHIFKAIASSDTLFYVSPDDYALKRPKIQVMDVIQELLPVSDFKILQLAYHECDFVHKEVRLHYGITLSKRIVQPKRVHRRVWAGTGLGAADIFIVSPAGAQLILDFMQMYPYVNVEHVLYAIDHQIAPTGTYSVVENDIFEDGLVEMKNNAWVQHLIKKTDGKESDLIDYYLLDDNDGVNKPLVREKDNWIV